MSQFQLDTMRSSVDVEVGSLLDKKYRVDRILGKGGMGIVVAATHIELETPVALKFLLTEVRTNQEVVARFAREARAAAQIKSEYVARTLDVGRLDNGSPYIVMEYLEGADLAQRIAERGPLPIPDSVRLILQACDGLSEAHALGIIHRDLKPSNLFVTRRRDGTEIAKLLDFGISKLTATGGTGSELGMTRTTSVMGSPLYMSPEQLVAARNVDPRSDIWALGVTLYEAIAGVPPFTGDSLPELCTRVMTQPPPSLATLRADVPPQLEAVIMRCLEKDPVARFQTALDLATALRPFALVSTSSIGIRYSAELAMAAAASSGSRSGSRPELPNTIQTAASWGHTNDEQIPKKSIWTPVLVGAGSLLALVAVLLGVWKFRASDVVRPSPAASSNVAIAAPTGSAHETAVPANSQANANPVSSVAVSPTSVSVPITNQSDKRMPPASSTPSLAQKSSRDPAKKPGPTDRSSTTKSSGSVKGSGAAARGPQDLFSDRN
jgi:eukaryotic-like serine/threonine-protein kinase